jgi:hypothetical protein
MKCTHRTIREQFQAIFPSFLFRPFTYKILDNKKKKILKNDAEKKYNKQKLIITKYLKNNN